MTGVKLRSNTSTMVGDRIYYIVKKLFDGKAGSLYYAYDFSNGVLVYWNQDKPTLIKWLNENEEKIEKKFKEIGHLV